MAVFEQFGHKNVTFSGDKTQDKLHNTVPVMFGMFGL